MRRTAESYALAVMLAFLLAPASAAHAQDDLAIWYGFSDVVQRAERGPDDERAAPLQLVGETGRSNATLRARHSAPGDPSSPVRAAWLGYAAGVVPAERSPAIFYVDEGGTHLLAAQSGATPQVPALTSFTMPTYMEPERGRDRIALSASGHVAVMIEEAGERVLYRWGPGSDRFCRFGAVGAGESIGHWELLDDGALLYLSRSFETGNVYHAMPDDDPATAPCTASGVGLIDPTRAGWGAPSGFAVSSSGAQIAIVTRLTTGSLAPCTGAPDPATFDSDFERGELWRYTVGVSPPTEPLCRVARETPRLPDGTAGDIAALGRPSVNDAGSVLFYGGVRFGDSTPAVWQTDALFRDGALVFPRCDVGLASGDPGACDDPILQRVTSDHRYFLFDDGGVLTEVRNTDGTEELIRVDGGSYEAFGPSYSFLQAFTANGRGDLALIATTGEPVDPVAMPGPRYTELPGAAERRAVYVGTLRTGVEPVLGVGDCVDQLEERLVPCDEHEINDAPDFRREGPFRFSRVSDVALGRRDFVEVPPSPEGEVCFRYRRTGFSDDFAYVCATTPERVPLVAIEVSQSVQDWRNSVVLVEDKPTVVRAYFVHPSRPRVRPRLRVFRDGVEVGAPRGVLNATGGLRVPNDVETAREGTWGGAVWRLEPEVLQGDVELRVEPGPDDAPFACEEPAGEGALPDMAGDCAVRVRFEEGAPLQLRIVTGRWRGPEGVHPLPDPEDIDDAVERIREMYPAGRVEIIGETPGVIDEIIEGGEDPRAPAFQAVGRFQGAESCFGCPVQYLGLFRNPNDHHAGGLGWGGASASFIGTGPWISTAAHELGHSFELPHATYCGAEAEDPLPIPDTTTINGVEVPLLGPLEPPEERVTGLELDDDVYQLGPDRHFEIMSYCGTPGRPFEIPTSRWASRFTYELLFVRIAETQQGTPGREQALVAVRGTQDSASGVVTLAPLREGTGTPSDDAPSGPLSAELRDAEGRTLSAARFDFIPADPDERLGPPVAPSTLRSFSVYLPAHADARQVVILEAGAVVASADGGGGAPTVTLDAPAAGDTLGPDEVVARWTGSDPDGDAIRYTVRFSPDGGETWRVLAQDTADTERTFAIDAFEATGEGILEVEASDGFGAGRDQADALVVSPRPEARVLGPDPDRLFVDSQAIVLEASVRDAEAADVVWRSDRDGELGAGARLVVDAAGLSAGLHQITPEVAGAVGDALPVRIARFAPMASDLRVSLDAETIGIAPGTPVEARASVFNEGPEARGATPLTLTAPDGARLSMLAPERGSCTVEADGLTAECDLGPLPPGASVGLELSVQTPAEPSRLTLAAESPVTDLDPAGANNRAEVEIGVGQPELPLDPEVPPGDGEGGCGCRVRGTEAPAAPWLLALAWALIRRRKR